jgi:hypothetical protein
MLYKTMVLEMIQQRPTLYDQLRSERKLRQAVESYASELSRRHAAWEELIRSTPLAASPGQIASAALELALEDLERMLSENTSSPEELSLDAAMAYLRRHTQAA